ncbi:MAG: phosphomethylpyrimidine synthase ThiC, partial [Phycisphaerae bacterium]|nr:phosphomethylpyrimidine synthase ThiC [Phycisphaerae bacterium]
MAKNITQIFRARAGEITGEMKEVARDENLDPKLIRDEVAAGRMIITANKNHKNLHTIAIGIKAKCKINANIGNSELSSNIEKELKKLEVAVKYGSDTVMDLSTGGDLNEIRKDIIKHSKVP